MYKLELFFEYQWGFGKRDRLRSLLFWFSTKEKEVEIKKIKLIE